MGALNGKAVLITGGSRRIGKALVLAAARAGAQVAFTYRRSGDEAGSVVEEVRAMRAGDMTQPALAVPCDVRSAPSIAEAVSLVLNRFGKIDVLINNAGLFQTAAFEDLTVEQWDDMFAVNVRGPFLASQHCAAALRAARGRIIHLGSLGGERPWATHVHYCASKAALHMLTRAMAKALAPEIAVNCVAPGMIHPDGEADDEERSEVLRRFAEKTPMRRNGAAADVVNAVLYFATAPHFITGQIMTVDGGLGLQ